MNKNRSQQSVPPSATKPPAVPVQQSGAAKVDPSAYRIRIYQRFEKAQVDYATRLKRLGHQGTFKLEQRLATSNATDMATVDPAAPNFIEIHEMHKKGKTLGSLVVRWFLLDDDNFVQFRKKEDKKPSKSIPLLGATSSYEIKSPKSKDWTDKTAGARVALNLIHIKKKKVIWVYHKDENFLKALMVRIRIAANPTLKSSLKLTMQKLSIMYNILRFENFWKQVLELNSRRMRRLMAFQIMGLNLVDAAGQAWQRNRRIMLHLSQLVKPEHKEIVSLTKIKSTFRFGRIKKAKLSDVVMPACIINLRAEQLSAFVRTRRSKRDLESQSELEYLCKQQKNGYQATTVNIKTFSEKADGKIQSERLIKDNNPHIYLERDTLSVEDLNPVTLRKQMNSLLSLGEISLMATDLIDDLKRADDMRLQKDYTIEVYGPLLAQTLLVPKTVPNAPPELCYMAPLYHKRYEYFKIEIKSISLPYDFVEKYNNKCSIKVKLFQLRNQAATEDEQFYVLSEDIPLVVTDMRRPTAAQSQASVEIPTNICFNVDRLIDQKDEKFTLQVMYIYARQPVPPVLKDYIMCPDSQSFRFPNPQAQCLLYLDTVSQTVQLKSMGSQGLASVTYSLKTVRSSFQELDYREGSRLLIGRYCILGHDSGEAEECKVLTYNRDNTVQLMNVRTHKLIEFGQKIPLSKVKLIEKYGVSVYDLKNMPTELLEYKYAWKCTISTQEKLLVNMIQTAIQNNHVYVANKRRIQQKYDKQPSGDLICSLMTVRALKNSPAVTPELQKALRPYIKVSLTNNKKPQGSVYVSDVIGQSEEVLEDDEQEPDLSKLASWVNSSHPLGQMFNLGHFTKSLQNSAPTLKFEVYNRGTKHDLLGSCTLSTSELLDLSEQAKELSMLLLLGQETAGILTIQTRFLPDIITRHYFNITLASQKLTSPESYMHLKSILEPRLFGKYGYEVPLGDYNWSAHVSANYMSGFEDRARPLVLKDKDVFQQLIFQMNVSQQYKGSSQVSDNNGAKQMKETMRKMMQKGIFISQEEARDLQVWILNQKRPMRQAFTTNLMNLWWARKILSTLDAKRQLTTQYWQQYMNELETNNLKFHETDINQPDSDFMAGTIKHMHARVQLGKVVNDDKTEQPLLHNHDINKLFFACIWKDSTKPKEQNNFKDLYHLIHTFGVADQLRSRVWRELLKVQVIEFDEVSHFKKTIGIQHWNAQLTVFACYQLYAEKFECLAFRQVDEDVAAFLFPDGYLASMPLVYQKSQKLREKSQIRKVLRGMVLWSRQKKDGDKEVSIAYGMGTLEIIQRLLSITGGQNSAEDAFWIFVGLIRIFPRPFSLSDSVLLGDCQSMMRYELVTFKALVEQNLPKLYLKLKELGIPIEMIVYRPIMSMYASYFSTDIVMRLWDIIFFAFSSLKKDNRKQGLWYILAPAYLILSKVEKQILDAQSCEHVMLAFAQGRTMWYDPSEFIKELDTLILNLFVEDRTVAKQSGLYSFIFGEGVKIGNKKAFDMENLRWKYQDETKTLFKAVQFENKALSDFIQTHTTIDATQLRNSLVSQFRQISQSQTNIQAAKQLHNEGNFLSPRNESLPLSSMHVFMHCLTKMPASKQGKYVVKITYGQIKDWSTEFEGFQIGAQKPTSQSAKRNPGNIYDSESIETYTKFMYKPGFNYIKIEIFESNQVGKLISEAIVSLNEIEHGRFTSRRIILRNASIIENTQNFLFCFGQLYLSFFLQSPTTQSQNADRHKILSSFKKRTPDVVDFFNREKYQDLADHFFKLVKQDYEQLDQVLLHHQALDIINESYNYVESDEFGQVTLNEFINTCQQLLPKALHNEEELFQVYNSFTGGRQQNQDQKSYQELTVSRTKSMRKVVATITKDSFGQANHVTPGQLKVPFCLRQFLTSVVLLSLSTLEEKISILYDLFQMADRQSNNRIRLQYAYQLISSVFNRSLYFMPQNELMNLCEFVFNGSINMVNKAFWTRDIKSLNDKIVAKNTLDEVMQQQRVKVEILNCNVDITEQIQHSFSNYFSVFGTKIIDFNTETSAFKELKDLMGPAGAQALLAGSKGASDYSIVLFLIVNGEHFTFEIEYDSNGTLIRAGSAPDRRTEPLEITDIGSYFEKESSRLNLSGQSKPITKQEFFSKLESIPMLANLTRVETFYQDRVHKKLQPRAVLNQPLVVTLIVNQTQFKFDFYANQGGVQEGRSVTKTDLSFTVQMNSVYETTLLAEVRERILQAFKTITRLNPELADLDPAKLKEIEDAVSGSFEWACYKNREWLTVKDFQRISTLARSNDCIALRLRRAHKEVDSQARHYDSLSLYKHGDQSYEWRPCRIVRREVLPAHQKQSVVFEELSYIYIIEFEHTKEQGAKMWLKRCASEILFSVEYTRYHLTGFQHDTVNYLVNLYAAHKK